MFASFVLDKNLFRGLCKAASKKEANCMCVLSSKYVCMDVRKCI